MRIDPKLKKQLDRIAESTSRSRSFLVAQAIRDYVALNEWQICEIEKGLREADRGDFASDREVEQTLKKWKRRAR